MAATRLNDFVFPGLKRGERLSIMAMLKKLRDMHPSITVHGFRSSFRDWAGEETSTPTTFARPHWRTPARTKRMPPTSGVICSKSGTR
jgi:hypothetical protein